MHVLGQFVSRELRGMLCQNKGHDRASLSTIGCKIWPLAGGAHGVAVCPSGDSLDGQICQSYSMGVINTLYAKKEGCQANGVHLTFVGMSQRAVTA